MPPAPPVLHVLAVYVGSLCLTPVTFTSSAQLAGHWEGTLARDGLPLKSALTSAHRGRNLRARSRP